MKKQPGGRETQNVKRWAYALGLSDESTIEDMKAKDRKRHER